MTQYRNKNYITFIHYVYITSLTYIMLCIHFENYNLIYFPDTSLRCYTHFWVFKLARTENAVF
jgi:hypothetical protein